MNTPRARYQFWMLGSILQFGQFCKPLNRGWSVVLPCWEMGISLFVRDGILSVADYNSTLMGVVVVVVVVVALFRDGIT